MLDDYALPSLKSGLDQGLKFLSVTANKPVTIKLTPDRSQLKANGQDLSYITVELVDSEGVRNPEADNLIHFEVEGVGDIIAVGSSNPMSDESFQQSKRKAYKGRCLVVVKSKLERGNIVLKASSEGFETISCQLFSKNLLL